jgi:ABC-type lipoprotein export system ATPase subunit
VRVDEPTANLDAESAERVIDAFKLLAENGSIVIAATHDIRLIKSFDTVLAISRGAVEAISAEAFVPVSERRLNLIATKGDSA